jgi:penicillin-binding protein 1A
MLELTPGPYRNLIRQLWRSTFFLFGSLVVYLLAVNFNFLWLFGGMPSLKTLENPQSQVASEVYSEDGVLLGKYYVENRTPIEITQVSPNVISALLATEDARFTRHSGIDPRSIFRAAFGFLTFNTGSGGGSTITQQTAKNLFGTRDDDEYTGLLGRIPLVKTVIAKTKEWILSVRLERNYTKQEILMMYLNTVSFGNNTYGIKTAARTYFNKEPYQLNVEEGALLVGMLQNPSLWNPRIHEDRAVIRRNVVLGQMMKYGFLTAGQFARYKDKPIQLDFSVENQNTGAAPYFRSNIKDELKKWLAAYNDQHDTDFDLYTSGLKIYTTIDSRMQAYAEAAVMEHMRDQQKKFYEHWRGLNPWTEMNPKTKRFTEIKGFIENIVKKSARYAQLKEVYGDDTKAIWADLRKPLKMKVFVYGGRNNEKDTTMSSIDSVKYYQRLLNVGFVSINPNDSHVKAWVGGINFKHIKFDHVRQGRRQPGSTFKPFVYLAAINENPSVFCQHFTDQPTTFAHNEDHNGGPSWTPKNSSGKYSYRSLSLRQALGMSVNTVSAQLMKRAKSDSVVQFARRLGVQSPLRANPTLCLGTSDVTVFEMVGAYCAFANGGFQSKPMTIIRITDKNGTELARFYPEAKQEISADLAYQMLHLMRGAVEDPDGTAGRLRATYKLTEGGNEIAAKTGTTSNYSDGWFMGMTQHLVSGLWVGGDNRAVHFRNIEYGQGARVAMPAWAGYMQRIYKDKTLTRYRPEAFRKPDKFKIDCGGYYIDSASRYVPPKIVPGDDGEILQ